jgi:hypothetical protein
MRHFSTCEHTQDCCAKNSPPYLKLNGCTLLIESLTFLTIILFLKVYRDKRRPLNYIGLHEI